MVRKHYDRLSIRELDSAELKKHIVGSCWQYICYLHELIYIYIPKPR